MSSSTPAAAETDLHVAVVGAGIVGICTALALQDAGHRITLIDKGDPGQSTSYGNAGVISPWSCVPQAMPGIWKSIPGMLLKPHGAAKVAPGYALHYVDWLRRFIRESSLDRVQANSDAMFNLCSDSVHLYRRLLEGTGCEHLLVNSLQVHAFRDLSKADTQSLSYRLRTEKGAEIELLGKDQLKDLEPALSDDFKAAVVAQGMARTINPGRVAQVLSEKVRGQDGTVLQQEVKSLKKNDEHWQIQLTDDVINVDRVVLAAGVWSSGLLKQLGIKVPLAAERGYHVVFPDSGIAVNHSVMDVSGHVIASSMEAGIRVAGIAEFAGPSTPPNPKRIETVRRAAGSMLPALDGREYDSWMGIRPSFPDSLPLIEEVPRFSGLFTAFGHSHYGLMMAPKTGRIVADLVSGQKVNSDLSAYSSSRF